MNFLWWYREEMCNLANSQEWSIRQMSIDIRVGHLNAAQTPEIRSLPRWAPEPEWTHRHSKKCPPYDHRGMMHNLQMKKSAE